MTSLEIAPGESLYYEYDEASGPGARGMTFVFVNALTGNTGMWQGAIAPALRDAGFGTLCYNFRGQVETGFGDDTELTPALVVDDLNRLLDHLAPERPIPVGLSIGGLFAAQAELAAPRAAGLVLINTLRKPSQRLAWIGRAMVELARLGGSRLVMAANLPMIAGPELLAKLWDTSFSDQPFAAMDANDGLFRLMAGSVATDWDFAYERLGPKVLLMTGRYDRVFRIDADIAELKARIPEAREIVYPDAGHLIPVERPERFTRDLIAFAEDL
jgi:pimeloyl-ACP methyl ester carboxylesterase